MEFLVCPRCETREFESKFSVCMNCNYGIDGDGGADIPIPAWVLRHLRFTQEELKEIREINFGFQSRSIPHRTTAPSSQEKAPVKPIRNPLKSRPVYEAIEPVETNQCVM